MVDHPDSINHFGWSYLHEESNRQGDQPCWLVGQPFWLTEEDRQPIWLTPTYRQQFWLTAGQWSYIGVPTSRRITSPDMVATPQTACPPTTRT